MFINTKPCQFLLSLSKNKKSVSAAGNETYGSPRSIYNLLDKFEAAGLIIVNKEKKNLTVKITDKGEEAIEAIGKLIAYT